MVYAAANSREIDPAPAEAQADAWRCFTREDLRRERDTLHSDVAEVGARAIDAVEGRE